MAVTGLGDWPLRSSWYRESRVLYTPVTFVNKATTNPLDTVMKDYFFDAAQASSTKRFRAQIIW